MIHLVKQVNTKTLEGISLERMACVNSPFVKGRIVSKSDFQKSINDGFVTCKKCTKIFNRIPKI